MPGKSENCQGNAFSKFCDKPDRDVTVREHREMSRDFKMSGKMTEMSGKIVKSPLLAFSRGFDVLNNFA